MNNPASSFPGQASTIFDESVAGEEDPGAAVEPPAATRPGDEAPAGTPGTGEKQCGPRGGTGRMPSGEPCTECQGTGKVTAGLGGGW